MVFFSFNAFKIIAEILPILISAKLNFSDIQTITDNIFINL